LLSRERTGGTPVPPAQSGKDERYDRWIRVDDEFAEKSQYIADNPVKEGLAAAAVEYRWLYLLDERPL
jgi:hypothetical protein